MHQIPLVAPLSQHGERHPINETPSHLGLFKPKEWHSKFRCVPVDESEDTLARVTIGRRMSPTRFVVESKSPANSENFLHFTPFFVIIPRNSKSLARSDHIMKPLEFSAPVNLPFARPGPLTSSKAPESNEPTTKCPQSTQAGKEGDPPIQTYSVFRPFSIS